MAGVEGESKTLRLVRANLDELIKDGVIGAWCEVTGFPSSGGVLQSTDVFVGPREAINPKDLISLNGFHRRLVLGIPEEYPRRFHFDGEGNLRLGVIKYLEAIDGVYNTTEVTNLTVKDETLRKLAEASGVPFRTEKPRGEEISQHKIMVHTYPLGGVARLAGDYLQRYLDGVAQPDIELTKLLDRLNPLEVHALEKGKFLFPFIKTAHPPLEGTPHQRAWEIELCKSFSEITTWAETFAPFANRPR